MSPARNKETRRLDKGKEKQMAKVTVVSFKDAKARLTPIAKLNPRLAAGAEDLR